ncbi:MAG: hydrogen peroxide-inducible genes activator [Cytophagales bacterium]|jgi:LysR family hydrogen peroxide-inducible transcriptional activator|nr:hydrogen peroxide-inducible genes activator [Cytophagales bacterium]
MTTTQLEYIVAVDTYRHFSLAAEHCFVTQPTLSMQIQKLEDELGVRLFDRSRQPVTPTPVGEAVIAQARNVLRETQRIREIVQHQRDAITGELRLGIIPTLAPYLLPLFLQPLLRKHPELRLKISEHTTETIVEKLKNNQLDAGLLVTPLNDNHLHEHVLFYEELVVYLAQANGLAQKNYVLAADIDVSRLWLLEEGHCMRSQIMNLCELRARSPRSLNCEYEAGSIETLRKMVELNDGITILPELSLHDLPEDKMSLVRYFAEPAPVREVSLVTHRNYVKRRLVETMKDEILSAIPPKMRNRDQRQVVPIDI